MTIREYGWTISYGSFGDVVAIRGDERKEFATLIEARQFVYFETRRT